MQKAYRIIAKIFVGSNNTTFETDDVFTSTHLYGQELLKFYNEENSFASNQDYDFEIEKYECLGDYKTKILSSEIGDVDAKFLLRQKLLREEKLLASIADQDLNFPKISHAKIRKTIEKVEKQSHEQYLAIRREKYALAKIKKLPVTVENTIHQKSFEEKIKALQKAKVEIDSEKTKLKEESVKLAGIRAGIRADRRIEKLEKIKESSNVIDLNKNTEKAEKIERELFRKQEKARVESIRKAQEKEQYKQSARSKPQSKLKR